MDISQFLPQLVASGIFIALFTGFIGFRIGRFIGRIPIKQLESDLEQWQQAYYSRKRIDNEGKLVYATLTSIYPNEQTEPGFTNYTVNAEYVYPRTGTLYSFDATFTVDDDSKSANDDVAALQPGQTTVSVLVVFRTDPPLYWMVRPW